MGDLNSMYFSKFGMLGSPRLRCQPIQCLMRFSWFIEVCLLVVSSHGKRAKGVLCSLFCKGTNPMPGTPPCDLISSQRAHLQIPSHCGLGFKHILENPSMKSVAPGTTFIQSSCLPRLLWSVIAPQSFLVLMTLTVLKSTT